MHNNRDRLYILINLTDNIHFDPPIYNDFSTLRSGNAAPILDHYRIPKDHYDL